MKFDDVEPVLIEGRIKIPYRWPAGKVAGKFLEEWRNAGRLLGMFCAGCQRVLVPPRPRCICGVDADREWREVGPEGTVMSWTRTADGVFALVQPDGADTSILHKLELDTADSVETGMRVTLTHPGSANEERP